MRDPIINRFAVTGPDGRMLALVADGPTPVPDWPSDLTDAAAVPDEQLAALETAYLAEFDRLAEVDDTPDDALQALSDHVRELREEAERRLSAASDQGSGEPGDGDQGDQGTGDQGAGDGDQGSGDQGDQGAGTGDVSRTARIDAMRAAMTPPAPPIVLPDPGTSREDLVAAVAEVAASFASAIPAATAQAVAAALQVREPAPAGQPARGGRPTAADLGGFADGRLAPTPETSVRPRLGARLLSAADIPNLPMGNEVNSLEQLVSAFSNRLQGLGTSTGVSDEKVTIASLEVEVPEERDIRGMDWPAARAKVADLVGDFRVDADQIFRSLLASGGLEAPVTPYYPQLVIATADRPVRDALPTFVADRGGIKLLPPPSLGSVLGISTPGTFADGVLNSDTSLVSATAAFTQADVGSYILGPGIPNGTRILTVTNGTTIVLTAATTATGTGVTFHVNNRNPNNLGAPVGLQTAAQDLAGNTLKYTFDVPLGSQVEFDVYAIYTSLQFANLTARTSPERIEAFIKVVDALHARVGDTQMLDFISLWSTLMIGAKTFGTARQLLAQWGHLGAFYRNSERMRTDSPLRIGVPAWSIQAMRADWLSTFGFDPRNGLSDDEIVGTFVENRLAPFFYLDGPSDVSQLFTTTGLAGATGNGTTMGTPIAIPDFPGSGSGAGFRTKVVSFMWAEGTWIDLTTGELNLGLVRDSALNAQNKFRNFMEEWETPALVGPRSIRCVHTVAADGTYGAAASITLGAGSGL